MSYGQEPAQKSSEVEVKGEKYKQKVQKSTKSKNTTALTNKIYFFIQLAGLKKMHIPNAGVYYVLLMISTINVVPI